MLLLLHCMKKFRLPAFRKELVKSQAAVKKYSRGLFVAIGKFKAKLFGAFDKLRLLFAQHRRRAEEECQKRHRMALLNVRLVAQGDVFRLADVNRAVFADMHVDARKLL